MLETYKENPFDGPRTEWSLYYDPLYGHLEIPPVYRAAMDLPSMQRLRWIRQLSTLDLVFPGANYSRFEHSMGVYHLAGLAYQSLFWKSLQDREPKWPNLASRNKRIAIHLAAILHDVGHGPWSHTFDLFCARTPSWKALDLGHKKFTPRVISSPLTLKSGKIVRDIPDFLDQLYKAKDGQEDAELLKPANIAALAAGKPPPDAPDLLFLSQIIASTFDVDRLDYLQRDAFHTGVSAGVDVGAILHAYTLSFLPLPPELAKEMRARGEEPPERAWQLTLKAEAAEAVEGFLSARDLAYRRIYYHRTHRVAQELMVRALDEIANDQDPFEVAMMTDDDLLRLFDKGKPFSQDIARRIRQRDLYELLPYDIAVSADLDPGSRRNWHRHNTGIDSDFRYAKMIDALRQVEMSLGCRGEERILWHLEKSPLTSEDDYTKPYFVVEGVSEPTSLIKLFPHLIYTHGRKVEAGYPINYHTHYEESVSRILVSFPRQALERATSRLSAESSKPSNDQASTNDTSELYRQIIVPVVKALLDYLAFDDKNKRTQLEAKIKSRTEPMLRRFLKGKSWPTA